MKTMENNPGEFRRIGGPIPLDAAGQRADAYLARNFPFFSRSTWQGRIRDGMVLVNGKAIPDAAYKLKAEEMISFWHPQQHEPEVDTDVYPIWKQGAVMAVYKPGNLPMHENGPYRKNTMYHLIREKIGTEWAAVHRLDRETSGIVLCGATQEVRQQLSKALFSREVEKEYLAIVHGNPVQDSWKELGPIGEPVGSKIRIKRWVVPGGLPSETWFHTQEHRGEYALLRAFPKTGRTNQIRIHAAYAGHYLVGDKLFYPDEDIFDEYVKYGNTPNVEARTGFRRLCLHATAISFRHPENGRITTVRCPMPQDMREFWDTRR